MVGHGISRPDGARPAKGGEVFAAAYMGQVRIGDGKVGGEHGGGNFAAVRAVADKRLDDAGALGRLEVQFKKAVSKKVMNS